jgi:hypothetical protein
MIRTYMRGKHVRKPSHFLLLVVSGGGCSEYLATAEFVEEDDNLLIVSMVECMLMWGGRCVARIVMTVPM